MNKVTTNKYTDIKDLVLGINQSMLELNAKCKAKFKLINILLKSIEK